MGFQSKLLIILTLALIPPLGLAWLARRGMQLLDNEIQQVAEEFAEIKSLYLIEEDLNDAYVALNSRDLAREPEALEALSHVESALIDFLAQQYNSVSPEEHQQAEAEHVSTLLSELRELIGPDWGVMPADERMARIAAVHSGMGELQGETDDGLKRMLAAAGSIRHSTMVLILIGGLLGSALWIWLLVMLVRSITAPLKQLRLALLEHSGTAGHAEPRTLSDLVRQIEEINTRNIDRLDVKDTELLRRERMAGVGLLAADVAHEINNPMNAMLGLSELALRSTSSGPIDEASRQDLRESLVVIRREIIRCRGIVQRLMSLVRSPSAPQWIDAVGLLAETIEIARAARPDRERCFVLLGVDRSIRLNVPPEDVRQIILTLLINAADAVQSGGLIEVDTTQAGEEIWLRVRDNGRGFTEEAQARFGLPFSSGRAADGGTGLGLSIAYTIAKEIRADLRSQSDGPGRGSLFTLAFRVPKGQQ